MLIGLDLGTTNVKAVLADGACAVRGAWSRPVALHTAAGGLAEQDLGEIREAAETVLRQAGAAADEPVRAIGVSAQGGAVQPLDRGGEPSGPVVSWLDKRGGPYDAGLLERHPPGWFAERIGHPSPGIAVGQALRLRDAGRADVRLGFVGDQVVRALCGRAVQDGTSAALTLLYNPSRRRYDPDVLRLAGLSDDRLPHLSRPDVPAGGLLPDAARRTGLPAGIPISAPIHDQYAAALACGAVDPGDVMLGTGTAWALLAVTDALPAPAGPDAFVCHHVAEGRWGQMLPLRCGGSAVSWVLRCTGAETATGDDLDTLLGSAPAGCEGLCFWPYVASAPADAPPGARGRYAGLQMHHGRAHLVRAVVEGLACEVARRLHLVAQFGTAAATVRLTGAAARSRVTPAVLADITGLPIACAPGTDSALGAAVLARSLVEPGPSLADLAREAAPPAAVVNPGPDAPACADLLARYLRGLERWQ